LPKVVWRDKYPRIKRGEPLAQQVGQLGDVRRNPSRLIARKHRALTRSLLKMIFETSKLPGNYLIDGQIIT
jgi:hypothetical protein